jgi:hypothetical protein
MKITGRFLVLFTAIGALSACEEDNGGSNGGRDVLVQTDVSGDVSEQLPLAITADLKGNVVWKTGTQVILKKNVFVEDGTLTIEPGVTIRGEQGSSLVITPTARLVAEGNRDAPIVFTSARPDGTRAAGDWGGVVLLGKAPVNVAGGTEKIEGFPATEARTNYGGSDAGHDCGSLKFVRIEFAGFELAPDNELNGLTAGGCGRDTVIDHVQVHMGADDGVEMFGGTADLGHILISQMDDDGLDWDYGWSGRVQFLVVQQNALVGDKGIEADSNKNDNNASPRSMPVIWNATMIGSDSDPGTAGKTQSGIHFRRGTAGKLHNFILAHFTDFGIHVDDTATKAQTDEGTLYLKNSIFWDNGNDTTSLPTKTDVDGFDATTFFLGVALDNRVVDPMLTDPLNLDAPSFKPKTGSPALNGAGTPPSDGFFDTTATFVGAIGDSDWTAGWTAFPAN